MTRPLHPFDPPDPTPGEEAPMPDTHEELPLPRFEDRLWDGLDALYDERSPRPLPGSPHRRGPRRWPFGLMGAAAIAAAVVAAGSVASQSPRGPDGHVRADASIRERILTANPRDYGASVRHIVTDRPHYLSSETWTDYTTGATHTRWYRADGSVQYDEGVVRSPEGGELAVFRRVDHCTRRYSDEVQAVSSVEMLRDNADWWRDGIAAGDLLADGAETIDGRKLLRFKPSTDSDTPAGETTQADQWIFIDPHSYEIVRMVSDLGDGPSVDTYDFLDRTPATAALATVPVPPGYTKIDPEGFLHDGNIPVVPPACQAQP